MTTLSAKVTSLVTLSAAIMCFAMGMYTSVYEARIYLCFLGLAFFVIGMLIEIAGMWEKDYRDAGSRLGNRQMPAPKDWPRE